MPVHGSKKMPLTSASVKPTQPGSHPTRLACCSRSLMRVAAVPHSICLEEFIHLYPKRRGQKLVTKCAQMHTVGRNHAAHNTSPIKEHLPEINVMDVLRISTSLD